MIIIKTKEEVEKIKQSCQLLARILKQLLREVKPGVTTGFLEEKACALIKENGARPAFKGYKSDNEAIAFPTALCTSVNDEIVHSPALPPRVLKSGDIIGIDIGLEYPADSSMGGYYSDMAITVPVGKVSQQAQKLIRATKESLALAIQQIKPGNSIYEIGRAVQEFVEPKGFSVVRDLVGHGVGIDVHEDPQIPNYKTEAAKKIILKPGMVIAVEPMVNAGSWQIKMGDDNLGILTSDGSLSAHFEHTIAVTEDGCDVLTKL